MERCYHLGILFTDTNWPFISRTIGWKYPDRIIVARWSKRPNTDFGRTAVKTTIYSHDGQKDRFVIFDRGAAKMGEISRSGTFETTGVMFRNEILSPAEIFALEREFRFGTWRIPPGNFTHFCRPTIKNYELVFLTLVRVNGGFDCRVTKIHVWSFWPSCDYYSISVFSTNDATNGG